MSDDLAIISTVDFFPPIVDDPFTFGEIAVANALSDVYALGGKPIFGLNIVDSPPTTSIQMGSMYNDSSGALCWFDGTTWLVVVGTGTCI